MTELHYLTIAEASELIRTKALSPVDLTNAFLSRIATYDGVLHSYVLVLAEKAISDARQAEAEIVAGRYRGPLHGIPIGLKDIYNTKDIPTTGHSALFREHVPDEDAFATRLLAKAGTILLGKTATWEFAIGGTSFDLPWPPACNPWNVDCDPAGSSSGSGAAVAAGLAMAAMGTDTGGSIRSPAAFCGLAGIKPTYGLVSRRGVLPLSFSLDHAGPLCWTSKDCALMMQTLACYDSEDAGSADAPSPDFASVDRSIAGLRIGFARCFTEQAEMDPEVMAALLSALKIYEGLGASIEEVNLAAMSAYADVATTISRAESYAIHEHALQTTPELYGQRFRQRIIPGAFVRGCDYVNAQRERTALVRQIAQIFNRVDVIVTPTSATPAHRLGQGPGLSRMRASFTRPFNVTGSPALSVCSGFSAAGLPLSMQIVGRPFEDHVVLRVGNAFEKATEFRKIRPDVSAAT